MSLNRWMLAVTGNCCAAAALAACSGAGMPASPAGHTVSSVAQGAVRQGWISPNANKQKLLFVSDYTSSIVLVFLQGVNHAQPIGEYVDGIGQPRGVAVDASGVLYVVNEGLNTVTEYPPGSVKPKVTLSKGISNPFDVAVDSKGDVYVSESSNATILGFKKGAKSPKVTITGWTHPDGMTTDSKNNLYLTWNILGTPTGHVAKCPPLSNKCTDLGLTGLQLASDVKIDSAGNILVADSYSGAIQIYAPGSTTPTRTITTTLQGPFALALDTPDTNLYFADPANFAVEMYTYSTGAQWGTITYGSADELFGIALYPGQKPGP